VATGKLCGGCQRQKNSYDRVLWQRGEATHRGYLREFQRSRLREAANVWRDAGNGRRGSGASGGVRR
jgi:hypothetical protein